MPISVLNSGHGDSDSGAVANGLIERDINMNVAKIAKELMEFNGITVPPIISGSDLNEVIRQVNNIQGANLCHSIHHNAGSGDGSETIHSVFYGKATEFAKILEEEFDKIGQNRHGDGLVTKLSSDGVHDYYGFIRNTNPPAIISEYAFIDSIDYKSIDTYEEQYAEGEAIAKTHCRFYGITYKNPKSTSTIQSINNNQGDDNVNYAVLGFSLNDLGACMLVSQKYGNCAIYFRNSDKTFNQDCLKADTLFVVGGSTIGYKNEKLLSGKEAKDTLQAVVNIL